MTIIIVNNEIKMPKIDKLSERHKRTFESLTNNIFAYLRIHSQQAESIYANKQEQE